MEGAMRTSALGSDEGGCIFFDFAAAFPSVEHSFIKKLLSRLGLPRWFLNLVNCFHHSSKCSIVLGGSRHEGFALSRGIRQGCPLSPLLFAVISDMLLRKLAEDFPNATVRAYADDLAFC
eukprot:TRINITY_DN16394_c0_g1_i1.p2 TRINITY_DN16394_c0_g1~~TRINITY_DN16394_c0_g1_i1.p2  ORF type:complete len:120 (+),score=12.85 TRINITY_DN16394_c0_g1_i1:736-1095(+)